MMMMRSVSSLFLVAVTLLVTFPESMRASVGLKIVVHD
jgi:hypothetical protein